MDNLSFNCEHFNQAQVFKFSLDKNPDKNNELIKLGDGTYGIVYQVETENGDKLAVKLFYQQKDDLWLRRCFRHELEIIGEIRDRLGEQVYNIVEVINATQDFTKSEIYEKNKHFKQIFKDLNVSDYAIVTKKYDCTLKDILEERKKHTPKQNENGAGYTWIKNSPFNDRIAQISIYLRAIATGIKTLHRAGKCHLDLKPSNIFVKAEGDNLRIVIGDLGALTDEFTPNFRLGTRHYRSPEQKDYFDICDAKIIQLVDDPKLEITDLKFEDTIVEPGDQVSFSKWGEDRSLYIKDLKKNDDGKVTIDIEGADLSDKFSQDEITQVVFYKKQSYRTDLFGLGAIAFDMLTGGKSPEQFYDNIRGYDNETQDADELVFLYHSVASLQSDRPDLALLFRPFERSEKSAEFADKEMVELILKCMLYKAKNTYYDQWLKNHHKEKSELPNDIYDLNYSLLRIIKNLIYFTSDPRKVVINIKDNRYDNAQKDKTTQLNKILHDLVSIYLRLMIHESKKSYYSTGKCYAEKTNKLREDIDNLKSSIIQFLERPANNNSSDTRNDFAGLIGKIDKINDLNKETIHSIPELSEYVSPKKQKNIELNFKTIVKNLIDLDNNSEKNILRYIKKIWDFLNKDLS